MNIGNLQIYGALASKAARRGVYSVPIWAVVNAVLKICDDLEKTYWLKDLPLSFADKICLYPKK
jgi:hypothetical protein